MEKQGYQSVLMRKPFIKVPCTKLEQRLQHTAPECKLWPTDSEHIFITKDRRHEKKDYTDYMIIKKKSVDILIKWRNKVPHTVMWRELSLV